MARARANAMTMDFATFKSQVLAYLDPRHEAQSTRPPHGTRSSWRWWTRFAGAGVRLVDVLTTLASMDAPVFTTRRLPPA